MLPSESFSKTFFPQFTAMTVIELVFPVFSIIALGYLLGRIKSVDIPTLSEIVVNVTNPCLIFISIARMDIVPSEWLVMGSAAVAIVLGTGVMMWVYQRVSGVRMRGLFLPAMFMNSGNMGLPFALLAFGQTGLDKAIIFFITVSLLHFTLGVSIAKGDSGFKEIFKLPLIYAALGGLFCSVSGLQLPKPVMIPVEMLSDTAIPLMLLNLGTQLRSLTVSDIQHAVAGIGIRMGGGLLLAAAFVMFFGITGTSRNVILLDAIMPPAVFNVILAQKYNANADAVASTIFIGTLLSIVTTSLFLLLVT